MSLRARIEEDFTRAVKARDVDHVRVLRLLKSAIANAAIAAKQELDDAAITTVVQQEAKKLQDALVDFSKAARDDLVTTTKEELAVMKNYLPEPMSAEELTTLATKTVEELAAAGQREFGAVMKAVMGKVKGRADGKAISETVRRLLNS